jgi:hypothetical protein
MTTGDGPAALKRVPVGELHAIYAAVARSHGADAEEQRLFPERLLDVRSAVDAAGNYTDDPRRGILDPMDRESRMAGALLPAGP